MPHVISRFPSCFCLFLAVTATAVAADDANGKRDTPVPASQQIPLVDFFRPPVLRDAQLNPSGTKIGAIVSDADKYLLMVYDIKTQKYDLASGGAGDKDINAFLWLDDSRVVYDISTQKLYSVGIFAADVGDIANPYPIVQGIGAQLFSVPHNDRLHPLVWNRFDGFHDGKDIGVAVLATERLGATILNMNQAGDAQGAWARDNNIRHIQTQFPVPSPGIGTSYMADKEGHLEFAFTSLEGSPLMFRLDGDHWAQCPVDAEHAVIYGAGMVPGQAVGTGPRNGKPRPLQFLDTATGAWGDALETEKGYDFNGWIYRDPATRDILGAFTEREFPRMIWFTDTYNTLQKILNAKFPNQFVQIVGSNDAQSLFLVLSYSDTQPGTYSWIDLQNHTGGLFKKTMPWIDSSRMRPEVLRKYKTRDGLTMDYYLTLPAGASKEHPVPLIVLPHGGPWARDSWGFDGEAQFFASRGYAVMKPNYRGSTGYNWMYPEEDEWDFLKMHYDVTEATKSALALGIFDPKRVAIMGGSFGGYLALQGAVLDPDLYCCAVTIAGVFDWEQLIADSKFNFEHSTNDTSFKRLMLKLGDPKKDPAKFDAIAPVRHIDKAHIPVFVNHGGYDATSDIGQSKRLISELEKHNIPVEKYLVYDETHGMSHLSDQVELYSRIEAFLAKYMNPTAPALAPEAPPAAH